MTNLITSRKLVEMTAEQFRAQFSKYSFPKLGYIKIPKIKIPEEDYAVLNLAANADSKDYLLALVKRGFTEKLESGKIPADKKDVYWKQAEFELGEINKLLFTDYILLVYHVIRFCRKNNILNSPGRGSCVGSLLLYLLRVTTVDPVKHGLLFERFISAARTDSKEFDGETYISSESLPDVDLDSDCALKHKVNEFIENLFPSRNCAIANYNTLQGKVAIKETCKIFLGYSEDEALGVSDLIDKKFGNVDSITVSLEENEYFQNWVNKSPRNKEAALIACKLQGLIKNFSVHASGIILTENPVEDTIPVKLGSEKQIVTAVDMSVAQLFGIKIDNLGLKNLTTINETFNLLGKNPMDMHNIDVDNPSIYQFVNEKEQFFGIFQAQDGLGKQILKSFQPKQVDDISLSIAVGRPGAMKFAKDIVKARQEGESEEFKQMPEEVKAVLKESGGYCSYQEQIMKLCKIMAKFSDSETNLVRKYVAKKNKAKLSEYKSKFIDGSVKYGYKKELAEKLWESFEASGDYAFNKCLNPETIVRHKDKGYITLFECEIGDEIEAYNPREKIREFVKVADKHESIAELYEIQLEDGRKIQSSLKHKFMIESGEMVELKEIIKKNLKIVTD